MPGDPSPAPSIRRWRLAAAQSVCSGVFGAAPDMGFTVLGMALGSGARPDR